MVGTLIGQGLVSCVTAWNVKSPNVLVMKGAPTDNNATLFAQGYDAVMAPKFSSEAWTNVGQAAGTWDPPTAETEFQQQYTAHKNINAVLVPNDENAAPIIHYLQSLGVKPKTFPVTGQDATLVGLQNILAGYQCGTAYKPIYLEAQAAAALAMYLRAGVTPPSALANGRSPTRRPRPSVAVGAADAEVGHPVEHGQHGHRGQLRVSQAAVRRQLRERLHGQQHHAMTINIRHQNGRVW